MTRLASWALMMCVPPLLLLIAIRLVMTPAFLQIEYQRPGFPADPYGMTTDQRLEYGPKVLDYLVANQPLRVLTELTLANSGVLFTVPELGHLRDVQQVAQVGFLALWIIGGVAVVCTVIVARRAGRRSIAHALRLGAWLTIGLIAAIALTAVLAWDTFFTVFHQLFFQGGTWIFAYSDSLIRLFPEQFWFDAAITVGALTVGGAVLFLVAAWRLDRGTLTRAGADRL